MMDYSKYFLPEHFSPLYYTASYAALTDQQRLRYNQLHGCYSNEQIMFLERAVAEPVLGALLRSSLGHSMRGELVTFVDEERRHTEMLRDLNRVSLPQFYERSDFYFISLPLGVGAFLRRAASHPRLFPLFVWLMFLEEERAVFLGREILRHKADLEPRFVATHRAHLADEVEHVEWDRAILAWLWPRTAACLRSINARLLSWMIGEFFSAPKRANLRVVEELVREFPELRPCFPEVRGQLLSLRQHEGWNLFLHGRAAIPKTLAGLEPCPEFACLSKVIPGYGSGQ